MNLKYERVASSNVSALAYNQDEGVLGVIFSDGDEYHYYGVPKEIYFDLLRAKSIGKFLNQEIKSKGYKYKKV